MISEEIMQIIGSDAKEVIVIADSEIDIQQSSIEAVDIEPDNFNELYTIQKLVKEAVTLQEIPKHGVAINITQNLTSPLHIVYEHGGTPGQYAYINVAPNVEVTIIEHHIQCCCGIDPQEEFIPITIEMNLGDNTHVNYSAFDMTNLNLSIQRYIATRKDVTLDLAIGMFGHSCQSQNYVALMETGGEVESKMMMFAQDGSTQIHRICMEHFAPFTKSNMINHGVVAGKATGEFEGIGFIAKGSHQADAQQESRIMALDTESVANVNPILLIDEYDVIAGHAGSVGRVSDESLFYLQSRGLNKKDAQLLVTEGFLRPVVENIDVVEVRENIERVIREKVGIHHGVE